MACTLAAVPISSGIFSMRAVGNRVLAPPGAEHGVARHGELLARVLRKRLSGLLLHQLLVFGDDRLQIVGRKIGIELDLGLLLARVEDVIELLHVDVERDFAEHLDEAAVGIVGEARIGAVARPGLRRFCRSSRD